MGSRGMKRTFVVTALLAACVAGQASAGYYTSARFLNGQSKSAIAACAGGELVSKSGSTWIYRSVGLKFHQHIWRHRTPRLSIPGHDISRGFSVTPSILHKNRCDVKFHFKGGKVSGVDFSTNVRGQQAEFTCGIVTDHCLP